MSQTDYSNVRALIAEPNPHLRDALRHAMHRAGFGTVTETDRPALIERAVVEGEVDLLVCDTGVGDGQIVDLTRRLRHHEVGKNPFLVVVTLASEPSPALVRRIIDAGSDDLVLKPVSPTTLMERIAKLSVGRKKFVVTTDYIGPDRRAKPRPGSQEIPLLDVPNPLKDRTGRNMRAYQRAIDAAAHMVNEQKVERHAFQIGYLIDKIVPVYLMGEVDQAIVEPIDRLIYVSEDIGRRLRQSRFAHIGELCHTVYGVAVKLKESPLKPEYKDVQLLPELATAIKRAFREDTAAQVAHDISETVTRRGR